MVVPRGSCSQSFEIVSLDGRSTWVFRRERVSHSRSDLGLTGNEAWLRSSDRKRIGIPDGCATFTNTMSKKSTQIIADELVISKIYSIRGWKVMLDSDLAELYQVETRVLNQAVKRNARRFPEDFMFALTSEEWEILKSQNVTSSWGGRRKLPLVFTEQGVAMLSSVLNSETAIDVNIQIIRVFTKMRELLADHKDVLLALEKLRGTVSHNSRDIKVIFNHLKRLQEEERNRALLAQIPKKRSPVGFKKDKG